MQKHAAMLIQLVWRERMRKKLDEIHKKHRPSSCYTIEAPAYFAESCLWPPLMTWSKRVCFLARLSIQFVFLGVPPKDQSGNPFLETTKRPESWI